MKLDIATAKALARLCRKHGVTYARAGSYPHAVALAYSRGLRTPNEMPYHQPRVYREGKLQRIYLIWRNETEDQILESFAYFVLAGVSFIYLIPDTISQPSDIVKSNASKE